MNKIVIKSQGLHVDITVQDDKTVLNTLDLLLDKGVISKPTITKVISNNPKASTPKEEFTTPPIWIIECEGCNDFITINRTKINGDTFICKKCEGTTDITPNKDLVPTKYTCECGTKHDITVHSKSLVVNTKCRKCAMPIDLKWHDKNQEYLKLY